MDYDGTSYCKNRGPHAAVAMCKAQKTDCIHYRLMERKSGERVGVCLKRYEARQKSKQEAEDLKKIQTIAIYNGKGR